MADKREVSQEEIESLKQQAVQEAKLNILIEDFQRHKSDEEARWTEMFTLVRSLEKTFPEKLSTCKSNVEKSVLDHVEEHYMNKSDGKLIYEKINSIKLWIVSTVGGFTAAGVLIVWFLKLHNGG